MEPVVSVIVVNFNAGDHLAACIAGLRAQTHAEFEAIVVDNGSSDGSLAAAMNAAGTDARFAFDRAGGNLGFAAANNRGATRARGRWIATLNPDAVPARDWLERLFAAAWAEPDVAMFGSMQYDARDPERLDGAGDHYFAAGIAWRDRSPAALRRAAAVGRRTYAVFSPCAAAALYRADAFRAAGGFDERFFCYLEDVDLAFRLRLGGHRCLQVVDARVRHVGGVSSGGDASDFARYHGTRNLVWCFAKNMPLPLLVGMAAPHALLMAALLARNALRGQGRTTARALADALRGLPSVLRSRSAARPARNAPLAAIAGALDWNPLACLCGRRTAGEDR